MKKTTLTAALLLSLFAAKAQAFEIAQMTLRDDGFTSKFVYYVDVYLGNAGDQDFALGSSELTFTYNDAVLSSPVLSLENPDFHANVNYNDMSLDTSVSGEVQLLISPAPGSSGTLVTSAEIRLGRITFNVNNTVYTSHNADLDWSFALTTVRDIPGSSLFVAQVLDGLDGNTGLVCRPNISGMPDTTAEVGQSYDFTPTADDVCGGGPLVFSIANPPAWSEFDSVTGELSGTPTSTDVATHAGIQISVEDAFGDATPLAPFDIDVTCPPGPTLSGAPVTSIAVGDSYGFFPDVDGGCGTLTFAVTSFPSLPAWLSFDPATGALSGDPTLSDVGTTSGIVITVTDENGQSDALAAFAVEVTPNCTVPVISGTPDLSVPSGTTYNFEPTVSNGCGTLTFTIDNQPDWAFFDSATGALTGTPDEARLYSGIVITVTDLLDGSSALGAFAIEVTPAARDDSSGGGGGGGGCFIHSLW